MCKSAGLDLSDITLEPLASAEAVLSQEKEAGVALIDIGGGTTDLSFSKTDYPSYGRYPIWRKCHHRRYQRRCSIIEKQAELLKVKFGSV